MDAFFNFSFLAFQSKPTNFSKQKLVNLVLLIQIYPKEKSEAAIVYTLKIPGLNKKSMITAAH